MYPAIDLTAGEKERRTMETILVAGAGRIRIVAGKLALMTLVSMVSGCLGWWV